MQGMLQGLPLSTITAPQIFYPHLSVSENHKTLGPLKLYTALAAAFYQKEVFRSWQAQKLLKAILITR